jgi:Carboxypeptidase regulatory-like domain
VKAMQAVVCVLAVLIFGLWGISVTQGQENTQATSKTGTIVGTVNDSSGGAIPGATVTVTDQKGVAQTAGTDEKGEFQVDGLTAGIYEVSISAQGFKRFEVASVVLAPGQTARADAKLEVAAATASVNVEAGRVSQIETESPTLSGTITEQEVTSLGLNGRNFTQLITLAPGVSNQTSQDEALVGMKGSVKYSVNGGRVEYNNFDVDGSDVLNAGVNGSSSTLIVYPSLDAISELQVLTSNYGAEFGRSASGTVLVTTKSGEPHFHGDGYEFVRNELFNARNYFDIGTQAPLYRRNDFGGTIGGPVFIPDHYNAAKDKTFFFFSEEVRREKTPTEFNQGVPSVAERSGFFGDVCPFAGPGQQVTFLRTQFPDCPQSHAAGVGNFVDTFAGNQVTLPGSNTFDPNAAILLNTGIIPVPTSNTGCNSSTASCYDAAVSTPTDWREELFRLDHNFTPKVKATFRYIHDTWSTTTTVPQWGFIQNSFPTIQTKFVGPGLDMVARVSHIISTTFVNNLIFSYTTDHITLTDVNGPGATWMRPSDLAIGSLFTCPKTFPPTASASCFGNKVPGIVIGGTNAAYGGNGFAVDPSFEPYHQTNPTYSFGDDASKSFGKHTLQFGVQVVLAQKNEVNPAIGAATGDVQGIITFSNVNSFLTTGNSFADFLLGNIKTFQQDSGQHKYYNRYNTIEPYLQDNWKVSSRLTVNLGLRVSLFGTWHEKFLQAYNWEAKAFNSALAATGAVDPVSGVLLDLPSCTDPTMPTATSCTPIPLNPNSPDPRLLNGLVRCGKNGVPTSCMKGHLFNPAPRIGFAWDPKGDGKTSIRAGYGIFFEHGTGDEANTGSLEGSAPSANAVGNTPGTPPGVLDIIQHFTSGYPCIGTNCSSSTPLAFPPNVTAIPTGAVWPYVQQWNLSVQRQFTRDLVGSIAYVGSKGTHLTAELQVNQLAPVDAADNPFLQGLTPPLPGQLQPIQPLTTATCATFNGSSFLINGNPIAAGASGFINLEAACYGTKVGGLPDPNALRTFAPTLGEIFSLQNVADSHYNGMQITLRRTKAPLSLEVAYSYSHSIDDSSDRFDSTFVDAFNLRTNKASSNFDQRQLLNISYVYQFSFLRLAHSTQDLWKRQADLWSDSKDASPPKTSSGTNAAPETSGFFNSWLARNLLEQWEFTGVTTYQTGTPFTVINGGSPETGISVLDNAGVANGTGAGSFPDRNPTSGSFFLKGFTAPFTFGPLLSNPAAFAAPEGLTFGNVGRNSLNNPSRVNFDMALLKHFKTSESTSLELRAEAFNIFNHTQFRIYDSERGNTASNIASCYGGSDNSAGFIGTSGNCLLGNSFLHPVDAHRPRTIQFGVKFYF